MLDEEILGNQISEELGMEPTAPPLGGLVSDALAVGVRKRRTRRIGQVFGGVVGVTAAVAASSLSAGIGHSGTRGDTAAGDGSATVSTPVPSATSGASAKPASKPASLPSKPITSLPPLPMNWQPVPSWMTAPQPTTPLAKPAATDGQSMVALLESLLPPGGSVGNAYGHATDPHAGQTMDDADIFWEGATVAVRVSAPIGQFQMGCASAPDVPPNTFCASYKLPDGSVARITDYPGTTVPGEIKDEKETLSATVVRPDGTQITVFALNGREDGNYGADRTGEPLTAQQLYAIASDPRWAPKMEAAFVQHADATVHLSPEPY